MTTSSTPSSFAPAGGAALPTDPYASGITIPGVAANNGSATFKPVWDPTLGTYAIQVGPDPRNLAPIFNQSQFDQWTGKNNGTLSSGNTPFKDSFSAASDGTDNPVLNAQGYQVYDPTNLNISNGGGGGTNVGYTLDPKTGYYVPSSEKGYGSASWWQSTGLPMLAVAALTGGAALASAPADAAGTALTDAAASGGAGGVGESAAGFSGTLGTGGGLSADAAGAGAVGSGTTAAGLATPLSTFGGVDPATLAASTNAAAAPGIASGVDAATAGAMSPISIGSAASAAGGLGSTLSNAKNGLGIVNGIKSLTSNPVATGIAGLGLGAALASGNGSSSSAPAASPSAGFGSTTPSDMQAAWAKGASANNGGFQFNNPAGQMDPKTMATLGINPADANFWNTIYTGQAPGHAAGGMITGNPYQPGVGGQYNPSVAGQPVGSNSPQAASTTGATNPYFLPGSGEAALPATDSIKSLQQVADAFAPLTKSYNKEDGSPQGFGANDVQTIIAGILSKAHPNTLQHNIYGKQSYADGGIVDRIKQLFAPGRVELPPSAARKVFANGIGSPGDPRYGNGPQNLTDSDVVNPGARYTLPTDQQGNPILGGGVNRGVNMDNAIENQIQGKAMGGLAHAFVSGGGSGQADNVPARLSDGEYVMDADVVSALGDGNNAAGAAKLDQMRQAIRAHKRGAPSDKIPPKAKQPMAYLGKGKK